MPKSIKPFAGVLFDLDDTLNDRNSSLRVFGQRMLREYEARLNALHVDALHQFLIEADGRGYRPRELLFGDLSEQLPWVDRPNADELEAFWRTHFGNCNVEREGAIPLLRELRSTGFRLGIVTNGSTAMQTSKIESLGLGSHVDYVAISESVGCKKPDPQIFQMALEQLSCTSDKVLFVGDDPIRDVTGPTKLGIRTAWITLGRDWPQELERPDFRIDSLDDLRPILGLAKQRVRD